MDTDAPLAPPVVAVIVAHAPGPWFDETLETLADQDYPNLKALFLLTGPVDADGADLRSAILARIPDAYVQDLGRNPGYGAAANEVLRLVEGDSGFFCFLHDDVAPEPDAIRALVEELYRSNAGAVGPKLVEWEDSGVLQHVGLGMDRFGEIDPLTEPGEYDQEQHDAVRDVFVVPSPCILVRADLFRSVGGFDEAISFHGDDVDLCWRLHLSGARVVVAPQARVRHLEQLEIRRPDLNHQTLRSRHRMRSLVTLTSGRRLAVRSVELVGLTILELIVGLFTGRFGEAWSSLRAFLGLAPRTPALLARRAAVARLRHVDDQELAALQTKGSARLSSYLRSRDTATYVGDETSVRRWRENSLATTVIWLVVVAAVLLASRTMINTRVPPVGELLPLPDSPRDLWRDFTTGWNPNGLGGATSTPTGWAVLSLASVLWGFHGGLGLTVLVLASILLGLIGMWRLATLFPHNRSRVAALVVYATTPLLPGIISTGRFGALVGYAAVPWFIQLLRGVLGIGTADPALGDTELVDALIEPPAREQVRRTAVLAIVAAVAIALAPGLFLIFVATVVVLALASLAGGAALRTSLRLLGLGLAAVAGSWLLNLPWSASWSRDMLLGPAGVLAPRRGLLDVAAMDIGRARFPFFAVALFVPVLVALLVARSWRLTWAARAAGLVIVFGLLAVLQDRGALSWRVPDGGLLLVPVVVGLAIAAAAAVASFADDVAGRRFGWRQPVGLVALGALAVGCVPVVFTVTDGAFFAPRSTLNELTATYIGTDDDAQAALVGDSRILFLGDPRMLPVAGTPVGGGVSLAVVDDGPLDLRDRWETADGDLRDHLITAVGDIADGQTARGGRLLAPFGVRYVVVPVVDGLVSRSSDPLPLAAGLVEALMAQLDFARIVTPDSFLVFENRAMMPTSAIVTGALAEATAADSLAALVTVDPAPAEPIFVGVDATRSAQGAVPAGTVHLGVAAHDRWELTVNDTAVESRPAFGATTAFDVATAGPGDLSFEPAGGRRLALIGLGVLWLVALLLASRLRLPAVRARGGRDETLLDLDAAPGAVDLSSLDEPAPAGLGGWVEDMLGGDRPPPPAHIVNVRPMSTEGEEAE